jgi:hypothetical protein
MMKGTTLIVLLSIAFSLKLNAQIVLFGEKLPIEKTMVENKLKTILDKLIQYNVTPESLIHKANLLFPYFDKIADLYGVPRDFKYLAVVESNLNNTAKSQVGAGGLWQIMPATGRELGLEVNSRIDERTSIEKSTHAAMLYLKKNKRYFNSWTLTASSYNCGAGCIMKSMQKSNSKDFYSISLNRETSEYIYKIIGVKLLFEEYFNRNNITWKQDIEHHSKPKTYVDPIKIEIKKDSCLASGLESTSIKKEQKKIFIKNLSIRTLNETTIQDTFGIIQIKIYLDNVSKTINAPYTCDYIQNRAYIRVNGIDIDAEYSSFFATVFDTDHADGLNIIDYTTSNKIVIPKNLKTNIKLYEYR